MISGSRLKETTSVVHAGIYRTAGCAVSSFPVENIGRNRNVESVQGVYKMHTVLVFWASAVQVIRSKMTEKQTLWDGLLGTCQTD